MFLPGAGAISTSRAGAAVASADDGEALALNPAGIAKAEGTTITLSATMLSYAMQFQRRGTYDAVAGQDYAFAGQPYQRQKNDARPPLGVGSVQPVPIIAVLSDLGGAVPGLHVGVGLYAPNAYPFRDLCSETASGCFRYQLGDDFTQPPPAARYDIMKQDAAIILPSLAVAYRARPELDLGVRLSSGYANLKSTTALWGSSGPNYSEDPKADAVFVVDAKDRFVPGFAIGATYRPTPALELAANYSSKLDLHAKGTATTQLGPSTGVPGIPVSIEPLPDAAARCAPGGTTQELTACVDLQLPMTAQLGARYKFLDAAGEERGDLELDLDWQNWGATCSEASFEDGSCTSVSDYRVVVDAQALIGTSSIGALQTAAVRHGLRDTFAARLGGSYRVPVGRDQVIVRGGVGYDTAAAKAGWLRADLDGAARTTLAIGASYRTSRFEISAGGGAILEGSPSNPNTGGGALCNPTGGAPTCGAARQGPDPINPLFTPDNQSESPVAQGDYKAHYVMFMLGASTWF